MNFLPVKGEIRHTNEIEDPNQFRLINCENSTNLVVLIKLLKKKRALFRACSGLCSKLSGLSAKLHGEVA